MSERLVKITVDGRTYSVEKFNPLEGMEFGMNVLAIISPALGGIVEMGKDGGDAAKVGAELTKAISNPAFTPLLKKVFAQCFTPTNERLADELVFNKHFIAYPSDMFQLGLRATWVLVKDFLPPSIVSTASAFASKNANLMETKVQ